MSRNRLEQAMSPAALIISVLALIVATGAGSAYAAAKITSAQIKNGAITTAKIKNNAVTAPKIKDGSITGADLAPNSIDGGRIKNGTIGAADLAPGTIPTITPPTPVYWAYITQAGSVGRGSPGVTAEAQLNSGAWQYRVTFPRDVSGCGYQVSSGDGSAIGGNEWVIPSRIAVARSTQGPGVLAVNMFDFNSGTSIQDTFFITVTC